MLFKRRNRQSILELIRTWFWPRSGWLRAWTYVWRRAHRLSGSPHSVAAGFAAGAFASLTPFVGFHFILSIAVAAVVRGSMLAALFGTFVGNPVTFPFIWFSTYALGKALLGAKGPSAHTLEMPELSLWTTLTDPVTMWNAFADQMLPIIQPMMVGGLVLGIPAALLIYVVVRWAVTAYQAARRHRLQQRRMDRQTRRGPLPAELTGAGRERKAKRLTVEHDV